MSTATPKSAIEQEYRRLELRVAELVTTLTQIKEENYALQQRNTLLVAERATLLQKNEQVRNRVEGMIGRLKLKKRTTRCSSVIPHWLLNAPRFYKRMNRCVIVSKA